MQPTEDALLITGIPPSRAQKLVALGVLPAVLVLVFCLARPFESIQLRPIEAFVPFYVAVMFVTDVITAAILFSQFSILRTRALLVIANGYVFIALMLIPYILSFPGLFGQGRTLIGGLQSTAWIYILRHCGLGAFMSAYALSIRDGRDARRGGSTSRSVLLSTSATVIMVFAIAALCISGDALLPRAAADDLRFNGSWFYYAGLPMVACYGLALALLWSQRRTVLGLWLLVVAFVHLAGVPFAFLAAPGRFSVGWYTVVLTNLLANSLVLIALLVEVSSLYARVLLAVRAQQREREARLITGDAVAAMIAHEVKQPLAAMITRAETGLRRLDRSAPQLEKAKEDIRQIAADGHRAAGIIDSIRANFQKSNRARASIDLTSLIEESTSVVRDGLHKHRIVLKIELDPAAPPVDGDRIQLQQVLINLATNAVESMEAAAGARVLTVRSETRDNSEIVVSIADTGAGILSQDEERIFNPLFTTKAAGMGMGLSICRSIIEAHGGHIWVVPNNPKGAIFKFALPLETEAPSVASALNGMTFDHALASAPRGDNPSS